MGHKILLDLNPQQLERLEYLKELFGEKTNAKTLKKLLEVKI